MPPRNTQPDPQTESFPFCGCLLWHLAHSSLREREGQSPSIMGVQHHLLSSSRVERECITLSLHSIREYGNNNSYYTTAASRPQLIKHRPAAGRLSPHTAILFPTKYSGYRARGEKKKKVPLSLSLRTYPFSLSFPFVYT